MGLILQPETQLDPIQRLVLAQREQASARLAEAEAKATSAAALRDHGAPDVCPEVVEAGSEEDLEDQFSFEDGDEAKNISRIRQARAYGNLRPAQYLVKDNRLLGPKMRNEDELAVVAEGVVCWRCQDFQPEDKHVIVERQRRLAECAGFVLPPDKKPEECCATCGAILGLKQEVA
jgi:hypothetical protein